MRILVTGANGFIGRHITAAAAAGDAALPPDYERYMRDLVLARLAGLPEPARRLRPDGDAPGALVIASYRSLVLIPRSAVIPRSAQNSFSPRRSIAAK